MRPKDKAPPVDAPSLFVSRAPDFAAQPPVDKRTGNLAAAVQRSVADPSGGQSLDPSTQQFLGSQIGHDFAKVRIHADGEADDLARSMSAHAFTTGSHIFFRSGMYNPETPDGMRLLAHEATHTAQQAAAPVMAMHAPGGLVISDPADPLERAADAQAEQVVAAAARPTNEAETDRASDPAAPVGDGAHTSGIMVQREPDHDAGGGANTPGVPSFQQANKTPTTGAAVKDLPPRNDIELMGMRSKARQIDSTTFITAVQTDIKNIREYFKWVNSVYERSYEHYDLVLKQANAQAETQQVVVDLLFGVALGVAVGALSEVTLGAMAANTAYELLAEVAAEGVEGGLGLGAGVTGIKPEIAKAKASDELNPALKKIQALTQLDDLNSAALQMAVTNTFVYTNPIVQAERLSAELRVAEAGGERRLSDDDIRQGYLKLMRFDLQGLRMENTIKETQVKFDALRAAYMGKQAPTDLRTEQDIWIPWLAQQNPVGSWGGLFASIVENKIIANHLVDIGLAARGARGGRLNADISDHDYEKDYDEGKVDASPGNQIVSGAKAEAPNIPAFWSDVFLMGPGGKK